MEPMLIFVLFGVFVLCLIGYGLWSSYRRRQELGDFSLADIECACHGVGREWIRTLLAALKAAGEASCQGKGPAARWRHLGSKCIKL